MGTGGPSRTMGYRHTVTRSQTFEIPTLHGALETLSDAIGHHVLANMCLTRQNGAARVCYDINILPRDEVNSRQCGALSKLSVVSSWNPGTYQREHVHPVLLGTPSRCTWEVPWPFGNVLSFGALSFYLDGQTRLVARHGIRSGLVACTQCWPLLGSSRATAYLVTKLRRLSIHTWRTVTGTRTPLLSHITVIPRFLAISPVRIESADHCGTGVELGASEFTACASLAAVL